MSRANVELGQGCLNVGQDLLMGKVVAIKLEDLVSKEGSC